MSERNAICKWLSWYELNHTLAEVNRQNELRSAFLRHPHGLGERLSILQINSIIAGYIGDNVR